MRFLPEQRISMQVMLGASCWLRSPPDSDWQLVPKIGLWGPRYRWCYGYLRGHVRVYALALTTTGARHLNLGPVARLVDHVQPLADNNAGLAAAVEPSQGEGFEAWRNRLADELRVRFRDADPYDALAGAAQLLHSSEAGAVALAAAYAGLSVRQFRRAFAADFGVAPKQYQMAHRVDRMLRQLHEKPWEADDFSDLPIGFADQAHAIRAFKSLTGLTPTAYVRAKRDGDATLRSVPVQGVAPPV
jgi:AraC-like DNA-binding protein